MTITSSDIRNSIRSHPSGWQRNLAMLQRHTEASSAMAVSNVGFVQHGLMIWLPKAITSRSPQELAEVSFIELGEMFLIYYAIPLAARRVMKPLFEQFLQKDERHLLTTPIQKLIKDYGAHNLALKRVLPAKAAMVITSLIAGGFALEYALTFAKNIFTAKVYKMDKFSDIVDLSQGKIQQPKASENPVVQKAKRRIWQCVGIVSAAILSSALLAKHGHKSQRLTRWSENFLNVDLGKKGLGKWLGMDHGMDFRFSVEEKLDKATNKLVHKVKSIGLSDNHNQFYMVVAFAAYVDSLRDWLEAWEVVPRIAITMGYIGFGKKAVDSLVGLVIGKNPKYANVFKSEMKNGVSRQVVKSFGELLQDARGVPGKFHQVLPAKIGLFFIPQLIGVALTGFGVTLLNQALTKWRYEHKQQKVLARNPYSTEFLIVKGALDPSLKLGNKKNIDTFGQQSSAQPWAIRA